MSEYQTVAIEPFVELGARDSRAVWRPPACCRRWTPVRRRWPAAPASATCSASGRSTRWPAPADGMRRSRHRAAAISLDAGFAQHCLRDPRTSMCCESLRIAACSSTLRSSRMLPRQFCAASSAIASAPSSGGAEPLRSAMSSRQHLDQRRDVGAPLAQRRHADRQHVQPVVQVFAELALRAPAPRGRARWRRSRGRRRRPPCWSPAARSRLPAARAAAWPAGRAACRRSRRGTACRRRPA